MNKKIKRRDRDPVIKIKNNNKIKNPPGKTDFRKWLEKNDMPTLPPRPKKSE